MRSKHWCYYLNTLAYLSKVLNATKSFMTQGLVSGPIKIGGTFKVFFGKLATFKARGLNPVWIVNC